MKIITHDGMFHADEIFAIALLHKVYGECPVVRTRTLTTEDFNNPETWVLDVGQRQELDFHNFDHHQNIELESTNVLILMYLNDQGYVSNELYDELLPDFKSISLIDRTGYEGVTGFQVNSLIRAMNGIDGGFVIAEQIASHYIQSKMNTVSQIEQSASIWSTATQINSHTKMTDQFPIHWKRYNEEKFLICPDENGKWRLHSIDSSKYPLMQTGKEEFYHANKFMSVFNTAEDAIDGANQSLVY